MSTVYVIHAKDDAGFVKEELLRHLPSNGYECWLASHHLARAKPDKQAFAHAMDQCQAILAVLSPAIAGSPTARQEIESALAAPSPLILVQCAALGEKDRAAFPAALWGMPKVDFILEEKEGKGQAVGLLVALLPPAEGDAEPRKEAERISWNEEIFSAALAGATRRHNHARAEFLVSVFAGHLRHRPYPYPAQHAYADLHKLRQDRAFDLMCRYAQPVIASGTRQDKVRRLFAQSLIETGEYARAIDVLKSIIGEPDSSPDEVFEAHGLVGRTYKQRYVNAPKEPGAAKLLHQAIAAYEAVYKVDPTRFWHGVNAASCMLRAERDGIAAAVRGRPREIAQQIAKDLDKLSQTGPLPVWDCASRAEALLALECYEPAEQALDTYIHHRDMTAFEVSSTFRQFDQVLQLGHNPQGQRLLVRLRGAVERYRAGKISGRETHARAGAESISKPVAPRALIIRVDNPAWEPKGVTDLVIQARLGNVVTARGSDASIRELMGDSTVISVDESRPAGGPECDRSIPFIRIAAEYSGPEGKYTEKGDRALIAIIDNGIDALHQAFLDANGNSRIVGIWDQTDSGGTPPPGFTYGTFHNAAAIAGYIKKGSVPPGLGRNDSGHGTHVTSIAGGRSVGKFAGGVAPEAKLLIVVSAASGPIGYSRSHLEALVFINAMATQLGLPVVVNVSQGMNAGAHDGKSALEAAFDGFSESGRKPGRVVVKSAGNERHKGGHAKVTVLHGALEQLKWSRAKGADYAERIELWSSSGDELRFRLRDPFNNWSNWVEIAAPECEGKFATGGPFRLVFTKRHVDNGDDLLLIELGNAKGAAAFGEWLLEIHAVAAPDSGEIHAWIERSQGVPTSFLNHLSEEMTLSIPGTASSVIAVGAVDASQPIQVSPFSSYGPTRDGQKKPIVCAPGVTVHAAQGGTQAGVLEESGTSMAAPHVAGAIALVLSKTAKAGRVPSGNQIASALRQKTQNYTGRWDRGQGFGVIDVTALLGAF
jgi:endonuclease G